MPWQYTTLFTFGPVSPPFSLSLSPRMCKRMNPGSEYRSIIIGLDPVIPIKSNPAIEAAAYPLPRAIHNTPQAAHKLCRVVLFNRSQAY